MIAPKRKQNCYDHRLRDAVFHLGQAKTARYLDIPRSTIHGWKKARTKPVVTLVAPKSYVDELERRVHVLERRTARLRALLRLCIVLLRLSGFSLVSRRLPKGEDKQKLLGSLDHASRCVVLPQVLAGANDLKGVVWYEANAGVRGLSTPKYRINRSSGLSFWQSPCLLVDLVSCDTKWRLDSVS